MSLLEKSWYKKSSLTYLLLPLSALFFCLSHLRRWLYLKGFKSSYRADIPVIVVGNVTVGGTGKTPMVLWLVEYLKTKGYKPGIVSRGYQASVSEFPHEVVHGDSALLVGDEPKLLAQRSGVPVVISPKRAESVAYIQTLGCDIVICDDGLQHYALQRDIEIILVDGQRQLGNGYLLPAGPLREGEWRLASSDLVVVNNDSAAAMNMMIEAQAPLPVNEKTKQDFDWQQQYHAVSAIGNPERFYRSLSEQNIGIIKKHEFRDHHAFKLDDFKALRDAPLIMTEKDAVKCQKLVDENAWYLPITGKLNSSFEQKLAEKLAKLRNEKHV